MAKQLSKAGIAEGSIVEAHHVTQSIDAFTGDVAYDITLSGSYTLTGSMYTTDTIFSNNFQASSALTVKGSTKDGIIFVDGDILKINHNNSTVISIDNGIITGNGSGLTGVAADSIDGANVTGTVANATNAVNATNATNATTATSATTATNATNVPKQLVQVMLLLEMGHLVVVLVVHLREMELG